MHMNVFADTMSQKRLKLVVYRSKEKFFGVIGNLLDGLHEYPNRQKILYEIIDTENCRCSSINLQSSLPFPLYAMSVSYRKIKKNLQI
jgi:hypothetical protein